MARILRGDLVGVCLNQDFRDFKDSQDTYLSESRIATDYSDDADLGLAISG